MLRKSVFSSILFLVALAPASAFAYTNPGKPTGYVSDFAHVLSASTALSLEAKLKALEGSTGDQIAVVTVQSLGGDTIENYAVHLFQDWGIGNKAHDNGLLILVSSGDHEARIEVGYGLEGTVTDLQSGNIIRNVMIPAFQADDYDAGISNAVDAVTAIITNSADAAQYSQPASNDQPNMNVNWVAVFFVVVFAFNILARTLGRTKSWWLGGVLGAIAGAVVGLIWGFMPIGLIAIAVLTIFGLVFDYVVSKHPPGGPGGKGGLGGFWPIIFMGRGGGNNFGGGGGFGGFGGGLSGGGGASGKW